MVTSYACPTDSDGLASKTAYIVVEGGEEEVTVGVDAAVTRNTDDEVAGTR